MKAPRKGFDFRIVTLLPDNSRQEESFDNHQDYLRAFTKIKLRYDVVSEKTHTVIELTPKHSTLFDEHIRES